MALAALRQPLPPTLPALAASCTRPRQHLRAAASFNDQRWPWQPCAAAAGRRQRRQHCPPPVQRAWRHCLAALQVEAPSEAMSVEAAWALLTDFTAKEARGLAQPMLNGQDNRRRLRDALLVAAAAPHVPAGWNPDGSETPEVLLGVVASDIRLAVRALRDYCAALGLPFLVPESRVAGVTAAPGIQGAVYIKYNSATRLCYASAYEGRDRGVLVQLGQQQLGHLPLGMFDEAMSKPAPAV